ncbi:MAG TPA: orotate phosphoribosyltransferase [Planctomycetota bacterium]|nr:orotate phosphoribosyltransferase [Planctomycetota bacterium]
MSISAAQRAFVDLLVRRQALRFGDFTLKSGRKSPYFINTGCFHHGGDLARLGAAYAATIQARFGDDVAIVFGPAYKGIPLALAAAQAYEALVGRPVGWAYDRKEAKDHGDGGLFVGAPLTRGARTVVVDDVITAGTALRETVAKLRPSGVAIAGAVVSVDRQERGPGGKPALDEVAIDCAIPVVSIITMGEAVDYLRGATVDGKPGLATVDAERIAAHLAAQR